MTTQIYINGQLIEVDKDEVIAITLSFFSVFSLAIRSSNYSNVFKVPKTQSNRLVFKSAGIVNSTNEEPYNKLDCSIKVDGIEIVGTAELISSDQNYFRVAVKAGNNNFFTDIKSLQLSDLDLSSLNHNYNAATVSARRDLSSGVVYPNIDYGYFERATAGSQPFNFFFPALYFSTIFDKAFEQLGYRKEGDFFDSDLYNSLALMSKNVVSEGEFYNTEYEINTGFNFIVTRNSSVTSDEYKIDAPLNFPDEIEDDDSLYFDTNLGKGYTTFAYNPPTQIDVNTQFLLTHSANISFESSLQSSYVDEFIEEATLNIKLEAYNKSTNFFEQTLYIREITFFTADYSQPGPGIPLITFNPILNLNVQSVNLNVNSNITGNAIDYAFMWEIEIVTRTKSGETTSTFDSFSSTSISSNFQIQQSKIADFDVSITNSFDDINIGNAFLYLCNVGGVIPKVDESTKRIQMVSFDDVRKNKSVALDWSNKIDLSEDPEISFKFNNYAKNNVFQYANDSEDVFLNELINYGQGVLIVDNKNLEQESVKYEAPFSLVSIGPVFLNSTVRTMGRIFTGDKYIFDGVNYNLDAESKVESFTTRVVYLSRSTSDLIQVTNGNIVTGNYEAVNQPILFQRVLNSKYSLISNMIDKAKIVRVLMKLSVVDIGLFDFSKPVYIDYFNDYFYVNEIDQFKVNQIDSTFVTLIRM